MTLNATDGRRFLLIDPIMDERSVGLVVIVDQPALIK